MVFCGERSLDRICFMPGRGDYLGRVERRGRGSGYRGTGIPWYVTSRKLVGHLSQRNAERSVFRLIVPRPKPCWTRMGGGEG